MSHSGLFRSEDNGHSFKRIPSALEVQTLCFGKPRKSGDRHTLFAIGVENTTRGIWRSDDSGLHWLKLNDEKHQYGQRFRVLAGDLQHYGRIYVGTDGRGIVYGEPARHK